jgi:hypothetical protein
MKRRHHLRALSNGGGDALDPTRAYVADGEHARAISFPVTFFAANFTRAMLAIVAVEFSLSN